MPGQRFPIRTLTETTIGRPNQFPLVPNVAASGNLGGSAGPSIDFASYLIAIDAISVAIPIPSLTAGTVFSLQQVYYFRNIPNAQATVSSVSAPNINDQGFSFKAPDHGVTFYATWGQVHTELGLDTAFSSGNLGITYLSVSQVVVDNTNVRQDTHVLAGGVTYIRFGTTLGIVVKNSAASTTTPVGTITIDLYGILSIMDAL